MDWEHSADWIQAIGSVAAIIIAIWTVRQQANRERDNRVIDDAAFASYIRKYLSKDIEAKIHDIANPEQLFQTGADIKEVSERAVERYETEVVKRLNKLAELPLTEWPDIQLANAFNDAYLRMQADLAKLKANQEIAAREADEELQRLDQVRRDKIRARAAEDDLLEDLAEEFEGSLDDGQVVALPPRGQRHRALERKMWMQSDGEDGWEPYENIRDRDAAEAAAWESGWSRQAREFAMEELKINLFEPLMQITASWQEQDADLRNATDRYIDRAERYGLPTTYDGRANRPRRLAPILR